MNNDNTITANIIPAGQISRYAIQSNGDLACFTQDHTMVVLPRSMTAMQVVRSISTLNSLIESLIESLADNCDECEGCRDGCPFEDDPEPDVILSAEAKELLGIPEGHKYTTTITDGKVQVSDAGYEHDITDVPIHLRDMLAEAGVCLGSLDEMLMENEVIWHV